MLGAAVIKQCMEMVWHHLKIKNLQTWSKARLGKPGIFHSIAKFVQYTFIFNDGTKDAFIAGGLNGYKEPAMAIIDIRASKRLSLWPFFPHTVNSLIPFKHARTPNQSNPGMPAKNESQMAMPRIRSALQYFLNMKNQRRLYGVPGMSAV